MNQNGNTHESSSNTPSLYKINTKHHNKAHTLWIPMDLADIFWIKITETKNIKKSMNWKDCINFIAIR